MLGISRRIYFQTREGTIKFTDKIDAIINAALEKKADDVIALDFQNIETVIVDGFIICSGTSERQVAAIAENIRSVLKKSGVKPSHIEGTKLNVWVLLDYGDIITHVFLDEARELYMLENLWHQAEKIYP